MVFTAPVVSSPGSVEELASVFPLALAQELAAQTGLRFVEFATSGAALPPPAVLAAHGGAHPTHVIYDSGAMAVHYVFADVPTDAELLARAPPTMDPRLLLPPPAAPSEAGPSRGPCAYGCAPHGPGRCDAKQRRSTPYPSSAERATSRASTHSSDGSLPDLMAVSSSSSDGDAPAPNMQPQEKLQQRLQDLKVDDLEARLRRPRPRMIPFTEVLPTVLAVYGRTTLRRFYPAWKEFSSLPDAHSAVDSISALVHQILRDEPFYHPACNPPNGQDVFDFIQVAAAVLELIDACDRSLAARFLLKSSRNELHHAHRRASSLFDSGAYFDENTGCLAREVAPAADHPIRALDARDIMTPLSNVVSYLQALSEVVEQSADVLTHYE